MGDASEDAEEESFAENIQSWMQKLHYLFLPITGGNFCTRMKEIELVNIFNFGKLGKRGIEVERC